jgi:ADP-ribosylglycohydrolase
MSNLDAAQRDRAAGVLLATAAGDALGAGYEFGPPLPQNRPVLMTGGGLCGWAPGEWTDDTSMAVILAQVAADGLDLRADEARDRVAAGWYRWSRRAPDVGVQTRAVLDAAARAASADGLPEPLGRHLAAASRRHHEATGRSAGNGSLMRTAPVALAYLGDEQALVEAAAGLSALTHFDPDAADACVLWCLAIRHAVLTGELDVRRGLERLPAASRSTWAARLDEAEAKLPQGFERNGWVVHALQAAWSAITHTPVPADDPARGSFRAQHLQMALEAAVRSGNDTDTVAAIAGGLLGAAHGASAVPAAWRRLLHGWPGLRARDLVALAGRVSRGGSPDPFDFGYRGYGGGPLARHPYDDGLWLGGIGALRSLPDGVTAVVSLCRVGEADVPADAVLVEVRLIDRDGAAQNPHLDFVLHDTVEAINALRAEGHRVLLHCVQAHSRTPAVAALYGARLRGLPVMEALRDVQVVLPAARPIQAFRDALARAGTRS